MKRIISSVSAICLTISLMAGGVKGEKYRVDNKLSSLEWIGKKVTGSHEGTISIKEGSITVEDGKIVAGNLIIDMNTIVVADLKNEEYNKKLTNHLNSDDFFDVSNHATSKMVVTKVEHKEGDNYILHGELTIKGHTEKIAIPATVLMKGNKLSIVGEAKIDRTKYGIKYGSGSFFDNLGDKAIDNDFIVKFKVGASI